MSTSETKPREKMNNAFDPTAAQRISPATRSLIERRTKLLGPAYRLFYEQPVHIVRGEGCRLWDEQGNEYLDAYNNVVSVGHAHPHVVEAVHRQMQTLCTHTRYLQEGVLDYAEDLLSTFTGPVGSGHVMFTCTGSEANDLALRIAKYRTGNRGVIVTAEAYHGNSDQTAAFSPALGDNAALGTWVRTVPAPDSYRIPREGMAQWFADHVRDRIRDLQRHGEGVAAFVVDSLFTSDGIYADQVDLLEPAVKAVHEAGGLFIADEVQCGFARTGEQMWGYQRHNALPDIVTMGKPMGNGYPVAGVAVTHDAVAEFGHDMRYFNTFGGNTVAIAAAQATFDVIRGEGLLDNARRVGEVVRSGLVELSERHPAIGDIRGAGLHVGVELVSDRDTKSPDPALAIAVVNALREHRVLVSATGAEGNVLKIRPPLVFDGKDADRLLSVLGEVLVAIARR